MFGLAVLMIFIAYILIAVLAIWLAKRYARRNNKNVSRWRWGAALVMFLIPFWDWIPAVVVHQYYCATESGLWVYKSPEQWRADNHDYEYDLAEKEPFDKVEKLDGYSVRTTYWSPRIKEISRTGGAFFLHRWSRSDEVIDSKSGDVLARFVDFSTSHKRKMAGWSGWKFWLSSNSCIGGRERAIQYVGLVKKFVRDNK